LAWCNSEPSGALNAFCLHDIEENKKSVEMDGPQHFSEVANWRSPELQHQQDLYKMKCANENGYSIVRILQKDIWHDRYHWLDELIDNIDKIVLEKKVQNIYMCKKDEYNDYITL
jgi:very-short-patch-repair endonuclease